MVYPNRDFREFKRIERTGSVPEWYTRLLDAEKKGNRIAIQLSGFGTDAEYHAYGESAEWLKENYGSVVCRFDHFLGEQKVIINDSYSKIKTFTDKHQKGLIIFTITGKVFLNVSAPILVKKPEPLEIPQKAVGIDTDCKAIVPINFWSTCIVSKSKNKIDVPTEFDEIGASDELVESPIKSAIFDGVVYTSGKAFTKTGKVKKAFEPFADMTIVDGVDFNSFTIPRKSHSVMPDVIEQPALPLGFNPDGWYMPASGAFQLGNRVKVAGVCQEGMIGSISGDWYRVDFCKGKTSMCVWRQAVNIQGVE